MWSRPEEKSSYADNRLLLWRWPPVVIFVEKYFHCPVYFTNTLIIRCKFFFLLFGRKPITWPANNCLQIMVCHAQCRLAWENSRHLTTTPLVSPPNDVWETSSENPYWWRVTPQIWVGLLICRARGKFDSTNQKHYPDLGSEASSVPNFCTRFGKTSCSVAKCRLFSLAKCRP